MRTYCITELPKRLFDKIHVEPNTGCWLWVGAYSKGGRCGGYGSCKDKGSARQAHVVVYEHLVGTIPKRKRFLDHRCRQIKCCNPSHLEPVTKSENNRRSSCWHHLKEKNNANPTSNVTDLARVQQPKQQQQHQRVVYRPDAVYDRNGRVIFGKQQRQSIGVNIDGVWYSWDINGVDVGGLDINIVQ